MKTRSSASRSNPQDLAKRQGKQPLGCGHTSCGCGRKTRRMSTTGANRSNGAPGRDPAGEPSFLNDYGAWDAPVSTSNDSGATARSNRNLATPISQTTSLLARRRKLMSFLDVVRMADSFTPEMEYQVILCPSEERGLPLRVGERDTVVGFVSPRMLEDVKRHSATFEVRKDAVRIVANLNTPELRTAAVDKFFRQLRRDEKYSCLKEWQDEVYAVYGSEDSGGGIGLIGQKGLSKPGCQLAANAVPTRDTGSSQRSGRGTSLGKEHSSTDAQKKPLFLCECAAAGLLGIRSYGCRLNGYVRLESGEIKMWVSMRSTSKMTYPGSLDNLASGRLTASSLPFDNLIKKCKEGSGISEELARKAVPSGAITFFMQNEERGWIPDTEYVYDLELDCTYLPSAVNGNVEGFLLIDYHTVMDHLRKGEFMPESALVVVDFFIRHGYIHSANEPDYLEIISRTHRRHSAPGPRFRVTDGVPRLQAAPMMSIVVAPPPTSSHPLNSATTPSGSNIPPSLSAKAPSSSLFKPILPSPFVNNTDPLLAKSNTEIIPRTKRGVKAKQVPSGSVPVAIQPKPPVASPGGGIVIGSPVFRFPPSVLDYREIHSFPLPAELPPSNGTSLAPRETVARSVPPRNSTASPSKPENEPTGSPSPAQSQSRSAVDITGHTNTGAENEEGKFRPKRRHGNCSVCGQPGCIGRNKRARCPKWPGEGSDPATNA